LHIALQDASGDGMGTVSAEIPAMRAARLQDALERLTAAIRHGACHTYAGGATSRVGEQDRSHHQVAAVDVEGGAGDVPGSLGSGEANQIGDFERGAEARHGIARGETFEQLVRSMFARELGIDHTGADGVHGDTELAELLRGRACQPEESGLRCRVVRTAERAHHPAGRGRDINDAAVVLGAHCRKNGFRHQERRGEVDLDRSAPFLGGEIGEACRQRKRGVIDEDVDPPEAFERAARDLVGNAVRRDVSRHGEGALADFLRQHLGSLAVADVHRDRGAALVQARCGSPSEAAPRTGDDGDAPRKISVLYPENYLTLPELRARSRMLRSRHQG
jgi:hypothetical protein